MPHIHRTPCTEAPQIWATHRELAGCAGFKDAVAKLTDEPGRCHQASRGIANDLVETGRRLASRPTHQQSSDTSRSLTSPRG
jgi:hypothetical protein